MPKVSILVVSCDKYSDLWQPFFGIFWKRWQDCPYPVYLGSNHKTYPDDRVTTITIGQDISWTTGLSQMLDRLNAEYVILFLEDFLIQRPVETKAIERLVQIVKEKQLGCLRLAAGLPLAFPPSYPVDDNPDLGVIAPGQSYRVSLQLAIWRTETLRKLLVPGLSAWEFEELGTQMSDDMADHFWGVYQPAIAYQQCVEKGKWKPEGIVICREAGVHIDLEARKAFSNDELKKHYLSWELKNQNYEKKRKAILNFKARHRIKGLRYAFSYLFHSPFSIQPWAIIFFGMLGPDSLAWLQRKYLQLKINSARARGNSGSRHGVCLCRIMFVNLM
jgi:hypothetical protein